ncbi:MAG: hypothetical protein RIE87_13525 [Rhodospirillales bacterium]
MFGIRHGVFANEHPGRSDGAADALRHLCGLFAQGDSLIFSDTLNHCWCWNQFQTSRQTLLILSEMSNDGPVTQATGTYQMAVSGYNPGLDARFG